MTRGPRCNRNYLSGNPQNCENNMKTSMEIAEAWYDEESIAGAIQRQKTPATFRLVSCDLKMPEDVYSPEFATWLTNQYRLAMAKGIDLARRECQS